ncbi:MAG: PAS domain-containing protein, partial [Chloroflexales bacterium]|nr:PAS domain-containing protein [Chloroflexales bacterium]
LVASAPIGIGYLDHELRYQLINPALAALNGRPPAEHLGITLGEMLPGLAPRLEPMMRQVLATGVAARDLELRSRLCPWDRGVRDWLISYFPVPGSAGEVAGVGVTVTDITQRRRTEEALRETERKLGTLFELLPVGIAIFDAAQTLVYVNPALEQILRMDRAGLFRGDHLARQYFRPDGTPRPLEELVRNRVFCEQQAVTNQVNGFVTEAGEEVWTNVSAVLVDFPDWRAVIVTTDVTTQRQAAHALEYERQQLAAIVRTLHEGVVAFHPDGTVAVVNTAGLRLGELDSTTTHATLSAMDQAIPLRLYAEDGQALPHEAWPVYRVLRGESFTGLELCMRPERPGPDRWLVLNGTPMYDERGTLVLGVVTAHDITARKQNEAALRAHSEELSRTNAQLTRALRLKDEFLAMMSHELRTPLSAILGITEALDEGLYGPLSERQRQALATVAQSGRHLLSVLADILDLAHIEAGAATLDLLPLNVEILCRSALQFVQAAAQQKGIRLFRSVEQGVDGLRADERRLTQILVNLLDNAVKFTPAGGTVGLEVSADRGRERIQFVVWDTGIGIAEADYERLFQPFTQVDGRLARQYGGVGLGLTLVRRLVDMHGGSISLDSTPGVGSRFIASLPWASVDNVALPVERAPSSHPRAWAQPLRVVIADDHELTLAMYLDLLAQQGCQVAGARTGDEAVAQVRATRPDVVVLDIQMPGMDGLTAIQHIRDDPAVAAVPIIALTALAMPGDRERCLAAGADAYLAKPVGLRLLVETIAALLPVAGADSEPSEG